MGEQIIYLRLGRYARQRRQRAIFYAFLTGVGCVLCWAALFLLIVRWF